MFLKSLRVQNFRAVLDETIDCEGLTALVGPNGSGKSCFLRALDLFYSPAPKFSREDFYNEDITQDIEITVTFADVDGEARQRFASYVEGSNLTIVRVLPLAGTRPSGRYYGSRLQNPDFARIWGASSASEAISEYALIRQRPEYSELTAARSRQAVLEALRAWESQHSDRCVRLRDDGQFFGFSEVAQGYLGRYSRFILIPAVRDAADDATDGRGSPIAALLDLVVRSALSGSEDLAALKRDLAARYGEIVTPDMQELSSLALRLSGTLQTYVPHAAVALTWSQGAEIDIPLPKADVRLSEDGYACAVMRTGHGLQRAFIFTMLQHLECLTKP